VKRQPWTALDSKGGYGGADRRFSVQRGHHDEVDGQHEELVPWHRAWCYIATMQLKARLADGIPTDIVAEEERYL